MMISDNTKLAIYFEHVKKVTDMPNHSCSGDTVFVEGKGCRQACPFHEIVYIKDQILKWTCSKESGGIYNGNSSHILADDHCELLCPDNYIPHPYKSTVCQNDICYTH